MRPLLRLFAVAGAVLSPALSVAEELGDRYADVVGFYRDRNFVHAFSTAQERAAIGRPGGNGPKSTDPRLAEVQAALTRLKGRVEQPDARMVKDIRRDLPNVHLLWRVVDLKPLSDGLRVEVEVFQLLPKDVAHYVSRYSPESTSAAPEFGRHRLARKEIHTWRQVEGFWTKEYADIVLLGPSHGGP
jgi:hypothetical protein